MPIIITSNLEGNVPEWFKIFILEVNKLSKISDAIIIQGIGTVSVNTREPTEKDKLLHSLLAGAKGEHDWDEVASGAVGEPLVISALCEFDDTELTTSIHHIMRAFDCSGRVGDIPYFLLAVHHTRLDDDQVFKINVEQYLPSAKYSLNDEKYNKFVENVNELKRLNTMQLTDYDSTSLTDDKIDERGAVKLVLPDWVQAKISESGERTRRRREGIKKIREEMKLNDLSEDMVEMRLG